jgi:hypothetical protein
MSEFRFPRRRDLPMRPAGTFGPVSRGPADKIGGAGMVRQPADVDPWMELQRRAGGPATFPPSFKKGGKVKRTGLAKLHKGERVVKASTAKKLSGPKIAAAARQRPASRQAAAPNRVAKPIARKPAPRR